MFSAHLWNLCPGRTLFLCCFIFLSFMLEPLLAAAQPKSGLRLPPEIDEAVARSHGSALAADLLGRVPEESMRTNRLRIREGRRNERDFPVLFQVKITPTNWVSIYEVLPGPQSPGYSRLTVTSTPGKPNEYLLSQAAAPGSKVVDRRLSGNATMVPFATSDFWVVDLGLEFLHWPQQRLLKKEIRRGQSCDVLESTNPHPAPGAYSKVVCWFDIDTGGIVHADAYGSDGSVFKLFDPTELQKVDGLMQVREIEMRNRATSSRSWVTFDLQ